MPPPMEGEVDKLDTLIGYAVKGTSRRDSWPVAGCPLGVRYAERMERPFSRLKRALVHGYK